MCTVSILRDSERTTVTMNRDESKYRAAEIAPAIAEESNGVTIVAPRDSQAGGTWIGMNDSGVVACLLNVYGPDVEIRTETPPGKRSRGAIVMECLAAGDWASCLRWAREELRPEQFEPCKLVLVSAIGSETFEIKSDTITETALENGHEMLTSSAWKPEDVIAFRTDRFQRWRGEQDFREDGLPTFHVDRDGEHGFTVLMDREWSCTRSLTQVVIDDRAMRGEMRYWPVEDQTPAETPTLTTIALSGAASS